jgi:hypothetical protein
MSVCSRALLAISCLSLSGCLTLMSPYGSVVSQWSEGSNSTDSASFTESSKIPDPPADNSSTPITSTGATEPEPPRRESPFDRARAKQQPQTGEPAVLPIDHRNNVPAPTVLPNFSSQPPQVVEEPKPMAPPLLLPNGTQPANTLPAPLMNGSGMRMNPTVRGSILNLGPNDTGVERAIELAHQLSLLEGENKLLLMRVKQLEGDLESREKLIDTGKSEIESATQDVIRARLEIEGLRKDLSAARERLKQAAKDDVETLQTILTVLRRLTMTVAPMRPTIGE